VYGIARSVVSGDAVGSENPLEFRTDTFERGAGSLVAGVGVKADAQHLPGFESMPQHEQLGFRVGRGADGGTGEPGVTDLAGVGVLATMAGVVRRPCPSLHIPEARGTDDQAVASANNREGHRAAGVPPRQRSVHIRGNSHPALRHRTPLIQRRLRRRSDHQAIDVSMVERFQANVTPRQNKTLNSHPSEYAMRIHILAMQPRPEGARTEGGDVEPRRLSSPRFY